MQVLGKLSGQGFLRRIACRGVRRFFLKLGTQFMTPMVWVRSKISVFSLKDGENDEHERVRTGTP